MTNSRATLMSAVSVDCNACDAEPFYTLVDLMSHVLECENWVAISVDGDYVGTALYLEHDRRWVSGLTSRGQLDSNRHFTDVVQSIMDRRVAARMPFTTLR